MSIYSRNLFKKGIEGFLCAKAQVDNVYSDLLIYLSFFEFNNFF